MKKILLLGAMGFVGSNLIDTLSAKYDVLLYDKFLNMPGDFPVTNCIRGDFVTETRWDEILYRIDMIIHLICTTNVGHGTENIELELCENVIPTIRLLEAMRHQGIKRMIFMSSGGAVYGECLKESFIEDDMTMPVCPYGVQKNVIEVYLKLYNHLYSMENIIIRVTNPYGVGQNRNRNQGIIPIFLQAFMEQKRIFIYGDGRNVRDYLYMDDLIDAVMRLLEYQGEERVFNVGTNKGYSIRNVIGLISRVTKLSIPPVCYLPERKNDVKRNVLDSSLLNRETGWNANIGLEEGIHRLYIKLQNEKGDM